MSRLLDGYDRLRRALRSLRRYAIISHAYCWETCWATVAGTTPARGIVIVFRFLAFLPLVDATGFAQQCLASALTLICPLPTQTAHCILPFHPSPINRIVASSQRSTLPPPRAPSKSKHLPTDQPNNRPSSPVPTDDRLNPNLGLSLGLIEVDLGSLQIRHSNIRFDHWHVNSSWPWPSHRNSQHRQDRLERVYRNLIRLAIDD